MREAWAVVTTEDEASKLDMPRLLGDIVAAIKTVGTSHPAASPQNQAATTVALGWQMAQLYGPLAEDIRTDNAGDHLPAISEYVGSARGLLGIDDVKTCSSGRPGEPGQRPPERVGGQRRDRSTPGSDGLALPVS
jgi:hypothetical protein